MSDAIEIRPASAPEDYRACQRAQRLAWGITEDGYVIPVATMVSAQLHGGLVLGAFLPDGSAVGLSFAFLGRAEGHWLLYSQLTGVIPGYQDRGIGGRLKRVQFEHARREGLAAVAWAFDPLQAGNARFNLEKLGATASRYIPDMYGPRTDALNQGTPTDRLIVEWSTRPASGCPTRGDAATDSIPRLIASTPRDGGLVEPGPVGDPSAAPRWMLEIPADLNSLREHEPDLAASWRRAVRTAFEASFRSGLRAVGFIREDGPGGRRCFYLLERPGVVE